MKRVVVTGMGIVSSIGNNTQEVLASLREAKSGIATESDFVEHGFRSHAAGRPTADAAALVDRRAMRFHGGGTAWNHIAMDQAIADAGLETSDISHDRTGIIMGSGGPSTIALIEAYEKAKESGNTKRIGPFAQGDEFHRLGHPGDLVQDPGRQLFALVGLRDLEPLHRQCLRDDPVWQAGCDVRRRLRGTRLDLVDAVRRHGSHVDQVQRDTFAGQPRL
jgi:hypothetical protein